MGSYLLAAVVVGAYYMLSLSSSHTQHLTLTKCEAPLSSARYGLVAVYDNDDTIYLFGGHYPTGNSDDILKYSIGEDTIEVVGHLPYADYQGAVVMNKFRNIFYLAGGSGTDILQYFPATGAIVNVSSFASNYYFAMAVPDVDTALLFGGRHFERSIVSLNLNTLESVAIGQLAEIASSAAAIWVEGKDTAYVFAGSTVQRYFRSSNRAELLSIPVPTYDIGYQVIWDGRFGYLLSGGREGNPRQSLIQFDPETETFAFIPVEGYEPSYSYRTTPVYIEKLNRIYLFGGQNITALAPHDEIYYIDLDPLTNPPSTTTTEEPPISTIDPDIFSCIGRPFSNYPYPGDCSKFVICREDHGYPFQCPEPLHFDPLDRHCTFPEKAGCL